MTNLRWKVLIILGVFVAFGAVGVYPLVAARFGINKPGVLMDKQLKLGLDLQGGVHLVLRVQVEEAIRRETETEMERLREALQSRKIPFTAVSQASSTQFRVEGIPPDQDA